MEEKIPKNYWDVIQIVYEGLWETQQIIYNKRYKKYNCFNPIALHKIEFRFIIGKGEIDAGL